MQFEQILTYSIVLCLMVSAVMVVVSRNPITSALYLIFNFFCLGALYLTLNAQFIAMIHILVYAGAIMVLFLFVIMLLNLKEVPENKFKFNLKSILAILFSTLFFVQMAYIILILSPSGSKFVDKNSEMIGTVEFLGKMLFNFFVFPFEITSFILLAAIIGALILAKKKNI